MSRPQSATITTSAAFISAADVDQMTVKNNGPSTVYYHNTQFVSSSVNTGSITSGSSATVGAGQYFATASGTAGILVTPVRVTSIRVVTQAVYDALNPDANTLFVIVG